VTLFTVEGRRLDLLENTDAEPFLEVDPVCPLPVMSKQTKVWVSHVEGPDCIWLQRVCDASTIAELLEEMYIFYVAEGKGIDLEVTENKLCAAKSVSDGQWYRGRILAVNVSDATYTVHFIDYGNSETIPAADVKELDASLFIPHAQAVCTALAVEFDQSEQITSQLLEITADKECTAVFGLKKEDRWLVDLFVDGASISKKLLDSGLVKVFDAYLFKSELKAGTDHAVFVSHIDSPCSFWIQRADSSQEIVTLQGELQVAADMLENMLSVPPVGTLCLGMYDEAWYRARVLESKLSLVTVHFIDYGNVEVIDVSSKGLKPLPQKMQCIPEYAERCSLLGSYEAYKFHDGASEMMEALVGGTEEPVTVRVFSDGEVKHVDIFSTDKNSVLMTLVEGGLATNTQLSKEKSPVDEDIREEITSVSTQVTEEVTAHVDIQVTEEICAVDTETSEDVSAVFVSHVTSPAEFWIQHESDTSYIEEMENRLLEAKNFPVLAAVVEGAVCAAEFTDGLWYRARVVQATHGVEVLFFDYGNSSASTELRSLPEDLLSVPPLAKCCSLPLLKGVKEWSTAAQEKFIERVGDGGTRFQVKILEEGDISVVSLLNGGQRVEEELLNLCPGIDEVSTSYVKPCKLYACISHVISPSEFWIQREESLPHLEEVTSKLNEAGDLPILNYINEGVLCVAQCPEDGNWYRAHILSHDEDCVEVMYVDFGNTAISPELRQLPLELKDLPPLAKKCCLSISNDTLEQAETLNDAFKDIVNGTAKLFEIEIIRDGNPAVVSMWHEGQNVEEELIKVVEGKKMELSAAGSETVMETCPELRKEGCVYNEGVAIMEDGGVQQGTEVQEEYNRKHSEGVSELDASGMQRRETGEKIPDENGQGKMEENWKDSSENISSFIEHNEESSKDQNGGKDIVYDVQITFHDLKINDIEDASCRDFTSQEVEESNLATSAEFIKVNSTKESTKDAALDSLNMYTVTETKVEHQKDKVSKVNVQNQYPDLHLQRTQHTEKFIREINIEIKTPDKVVNKALGDLYSERIVPASISRGLSREELLGAIPRSASPKLRHDEKIVPGCISQKRLADTDRGDGTKSAPSTPLVSRSSKILQRVSSCDEFRQRNVSSPKLTHNDRIVPGSITRGETEEEIRPLTPKLPHAEKIVPGSISQGISDEELGSDQLQAPVMKTHECDGEEAVEDNSLSAAEVVDFTSIAVLQP
jgi:tudor domain-containing protein 1/4/6/7